MEALKSNVNDIHNSWERIYSTVKMVQKNHNLKQKP
jgi:hypothetical protein